MSSAKITLFTFAKYMQQHDDDLFVNLYVPDGINKDTLTENILLRGGEFEVIYSDPTFMQYAIGTWSKKWYRTMDKWLQALALDYNPLENYDRYENIQDKNNKTSNMERTLDHEDATVINTQDLRTLDTEDLRTLNTQELRTLDTDVLNTKNLMDEENRDLKDKETRDLQDVTTYDHDTEVEQLVSAYDSSSYQPSSKTLNKDSDSDHNTVTLDQDGTDTFEHTGKDVFNHTGYDDTKNTGTDTMNNTGTDTTDHTGTDTMNRTGTETTGHTGTISDEGGEDSFNDHIGHIHGNIGVTSSQDLLSQELSIDEWNIYEHITDLFLTEFVIPIYT